MHTITGKLSFLKQSPFRTNLSTMGAEWPATGDTVPLRFVPREDLRFIHYALYFTRSFPVPPLSRIPALQNI